MCIACSPFGTALHAGSATSRRSVLGGIGRITLGAGAVGFGSLLRCAEAQTPPAASGAADLIYSGGPIVTINDAQPLAEAVAVRAGRILAVGTRAQVEATRGAGTRMVNLEGRTMLPGFVDPHGHLVMVGLQAVGANMLPAPDGEGIRGRRQHRRHLGCGGDGGAPRRAPYPRAVAGAAGGGGHRPGRAQLPLAAGHALGCAA